ncbi:MAG: DUF2683 family protein [Ginsengibacter sp.]
MQTEDIYIVHPTKDQASALKAFIKALNIEFEVTTNDNLYNPEFVAKIKKSKQEFKQGNFVRVEKADLKNFLGL